MTPAQRAALRSKAKAATPGPWIAQPGMAHFWMVDSQGGPGTVAHGTHEPDARFIAAHSPEVIAGLLDDLDAAERELAALKAERVALVERAVRAGWVAADSETLKEDFKRIALRVLAEPDAQGTT